jgi:hypothetical protein
MISLYTMIIPVFMLLMFWLLYKYAVHRAKYLVSNNFSTFPGKFARDEAIMEVAPAPQPTHQFDATAYMSAVTASSCYLKGEKISINPDIALSRQ